MTNEARAIPVSVKALQTFPETMMINTNVKPCVLEKEMNIVNLKREVLIDEKDFLCQNVKPDRHMIYLRCKHVLSEDDCEEIECEKTRSKRASKFFDILETRGEKGFDEFCISIVKDKTQMFLLERLEESLERKKAAFCKDDIDSDFSDEDFDKSLLPIPGDQGAPPL